MVDRLDDVRRAGSSRRVVGGVRDGDSAHSPDVRHALGRIEDRRDCLPPARLANQGEVENGQPETIHRLGHLAQSGQPVAAPRGSVHDEAIGDAQEGGRQGHAERRLAGPPHRDRQVVDEQRLDDRPEVASRVAARGQVDHLGAGLGRVLAGQDAVRLDVGVDPRRAVRIAGRDDEGSRRVPAGQLLDRGRAAFADLRAPRDDYQVHHAGAGGDVPRLLPVHARDELRDRPHARQLAVDLFDAVGARGPAQDRLARLLRSAVEDQAAQVDARGSTHARAALHVLLNDVAFSHQILRHLRPSLASR